MIHILRLVNPENEYVCKAIFAPPLETAPDAIRFDGAVYVRDDAGNYVESLLMPNSGDYLDVATYNDDPEEQVQDGQE